MVWKIGFTCGQAVVEPPGMMDGPEQRAFLAAGDAGADVEQALALHVLGAADRVGEVASCRRR